MTSAKVDAVVVGGGPNGLSAGIALAQGGRSVLVLEAQDRLGGAVATEELTLPGFHHDVFSSVYPAGAASPVFAKLPLERHGLRWVHPEIPMAHPLDGGRAIALMRGLDATAATLDAVHPGGGAAWRDLAGPYVEHYEALRATMLSGFPPVTGPARLVAALRVGGTLDFVQILLSSARALGERLFEDPGARGWLYGSAMHGDVPPSNSGSAISAVYLKVLAHAVGWPSPEGGAGRLADALAGVLRAEGGEARTGTRVARVLTARNRVAGVRTDEGDVVQARIVVCDTTPRGLLALAQDALPDAYVRRLVAFRYGPSTVKVDWALDGPVPWAASLPRTAGTVHLGGTAREITDALEASEAGRVPEHPFLLFGQQSIADPTRAPAGKHTAWAYTHVPRSIDWARELEPFTARIEAQVERFAPGFRDLILARHTMDPGDLQIRNDNLEHGDVGGGSYELDQLVFRPVPSLSPYRTPLRGLYLGSASAFPGGAVHGIPGDAAGRAALQDAKLRRV
jgi:phytoene dehydrogenase-like protein